MSQFTGHDLVCIRGERRVFSGLGFSIGPGGALILAGPNGSGKSSLLRLMAGLSRPAAGMLAWDGEDIGQDPEAHNARFHYVGHLDAVKPALGVLENLEFWTGLRPGTGQDTGSAKGQAEMKALEAFAISHLADIPGRFLSAGQKRRVGLARIIAAPAGLWLLDEPTTALDAGAMENLRAAIGEHRSGGGMVVVSTHSDIGLDGAQGLELSDFAAGPAAGGGFEHERGQW